MTITRQSAKRKGRALEQLVVDALLKRYPTLTTDDVARVAPNCAGNDIVLSEKGRSEIGLNVECKARAVGFTNVYDALQQAHRDNGSIDVAIIKQDRRKPLAVIDMETLLDLLARASGKPPEAG